MIRMTKLSDYGLVLLTHIARSPDRPAWSAVELAGEAQLPLPTVTKLLKNLARAGVLSSQRGARGGYCLARPAAQITVVEIVEALEGPISLTECVDDQQEATCGYQALCPTRGNWQQINAAIRQALGGITLEGLGGTAREPLGVVVPLQAASATLAWGGR